MVSFSLLSVEATTIVFIVLLVVLIVALLVVPMFTNKKRAKQTEELHNSLQPGDLIKTVGGIIGTIKEIRQVSPVDKEMIIETGVGDNKTTMTFDIAALYQVMSRTSSAAVEKTEEEDKATEPDVAEEKPAVEPIVAVEEPVAEEAKPESKDEVDSAAHEEPVAEQAATESVAEEVGTESGDEAVEQNNAANHPAKKPVAKKAGGVKSDKSTKK